jgi:hypothetical protein
MNKSTIVSMLAIALAGCSSAATHASSDLSAPNGPNDASTPLNDFNSADIAPSISCDDYCNAVLVNCVGAATQYPSTTLCSAECGHFTTGSYQDRGDSVGCRQYFASNPSVTGACTAAGPSGGGVCGTRCDAFCTLTFAVCVAANRGATNPYNSISDCMTSCGGFKFDATAPEYDPANHNTLNCRQYALQRAFSDTAGGSALNECPHLAPTSATCNQ